MPLSLFFSSFTQKAGLAVFAGLPVKNRGIPKAL